MDYGEPIRSAALRELPAVSQTPRITSEGPRRRRRVIAAPAAEERLDDGCGGDPGSDLVAADPEADSDAGGADTTAPRRAPEDLDSLLILNQTLLLSTDPALKIPTGRNRD